MANTALATVGGPTFIYDFKYNPSNESVYYNLFSESGRGCPPMLMKMSLNSGKTDTVFSCDDGEKLSRDNSYPFYNSVHEAINKITGAFKNLTPVNLKKNKISVDISFVNYKNIAPDVPEIKNANFTASVYQDGKKIADFPISGCNLEQPFVFAGYAIPGFDKKIVLLSSAKGDCWEGGYISENLHIVPGVDKLDKAYLSNFYKGPSALIPNEGTLVVFESESVDVERDGTGNLNPVAENNYNSKNSGAIPYAVIGVVLALGLGYFLGRKTKKI